MPLLIFDRRHTENIPVHSSFAYWMRKSCAKLFFSEVIILSKSIYVGNLPWSAQEEQVRNLFSAYGSVISVNIVTDRETGRARGFGFVEMDDADAAAAVQALDGKELDGRALRVNEAQPKPPRTPRY